MLILYEIISDYIINNDIYFTTSIDLVSLNKIHDFLGLCHIGERNEIDKKLFFIR